MSIDSEAYRDQLVSLLPPGRLFTREDQSTLSLLLLGLSDELARLDAKIDGLLYEALPSAATDLLGDWERVAGLPDCGALPTTLEGRRALVTQRITTPGSLTPASLIANILGSLGIVVTIEEFEPSELGWMQIGTEVAPNWCWWWFDVLTSDLITVEFEVGSSTAGSPLGSMQNDSLTCLIDKLKPEHTHYRLVQS